MAPRDVAPRDVACRDTSAPGSSEPSLDSGGILVAAACIAVVAAWGLSAAFESERSAGGAGMPVVRRFEVPIHRIDINRAGVSELALLPEIGPGLAESIAVDRALHGSFASVDELVRVRGIGPARIEALRPAAIASGSAARETRPAGASR